MQSCRKINAGLHPDDIRDPDLFELFAEGGDWSRQDWMNRPVEKGPIDQFKYYNEFMGRIGTFSESKLLLHSKTNGTEFFKPISKAVAPVVYHFNAYSIKNKVLNVRPNVSFRRATGVLQFMDPTEFFESNLMLHQEPIVPVALDGLVGFFDINFLANTPNLQFGISHWEYAGTLEPQYAFVAKKEPEIKQDYIEM